MDTHLVVTFKKKCEIMKLVLITILLWIIQSPHSNASSIGPGGYGPPMPTHSSSTLDLNADALHTKPSRPPPNTSKGSMLLKHLGPFLDSGSNLKILDLLAEKRKELAAAGGGVADIKPDLGGLGSNNSSASTSSSTSSGPKNAKRSRRYEEQDPLT